MTPSVDNLHEFRATGEDACVILDVLLPPYDDASRPCTFYEALKDDNSALEEWIELSVADEPSDLPVVVPYKGFKPLD